MLGVVGFFEMIILTIIGMIGGLLPDIDLDTSKISQIGFTFASLFGASFLMVLFINYRPSHFGKSLEPIDMIIVWGVLFLILKFIVFWLFSKFTKHRGMVHSIPYMAVLSLGFVLLSFYFLKLPPTLSWLFGLFLFFGSVVHLILDEIYSVNVYGLKIKKSFGSALKFYDPKKPLQYTTLYLILFALWFLAPAKTTLIKILLPVFGRI